MCFLVELAYRMNRFNDMIGIRVQVIVGRLNRNDAEDKPAFVGGNCYKLKKDFSTTPFLSVGIDPIDELMITIIYL